jgi:hypothetical protein
MGSSFDQAESMIQLIDRGGLTDGSADAFFEAAARISSAYELSRVLQRVTAKAALTDHIVEGLLRTAGKIDGNYERANVLEAVARHARITGTSRELYIAATKSLGSYEENRALAALVRAEGRK